MAGATKKTDRQYVALFEQGRNQWTGRPNYAIECVGQPGETIEDVFESAKKTLWGEWPEDQPEIKIVTLSACKRSYSRAYREWLETPPMSEAEIAMMLKRS